MKKTKLKKTKQSKGKHKKTCLQVLNLSDKVEVVSEIKT
jgi:hypothetical protein